jgi:CheY-like chemotaxis protein
MPQEPLEQKPSWANASTEIAGWESPWSVSASPSSGGAGNSDESVPALRQKEHAQLVNRTTFDIVLMDGQMPEMDGFAATKLIREKEKASGTHLTIIA